MTVVPFDFPTYVGLLDDHSSALRTSAVAAGPTAPVPSCPEWTVLDLIVHIGRVHSFVEASIGADPEQRPVFDTPEPEWDLALAFWDKHRSGLVDRLTEAGPDGPSWGFLPNAPRTAGWWARRQAHEAAIHRLDADLAVTGDLPNLLFPTTFAADGVDELLELISNRESTVATTVLLHAADAGRYWVVITEPGQSITVETSGLAAVDADVSVVGTADAVYRHVWGRPSTAVVTGDPSHLEPLRAP